MITFGYTSAAVVNFWIFAIGGNQVNLIIAIACTVGAVGALIFEMS